jgi:gamma-glutamylputrescine oxidase
MIWQFVNRDLVRQEWDSFYTDDQNFYQESVGTIPKAPALTEASTADVVVIGGGLTGLATAILLAEQDLNVVILERHFIGWGASGRNGGQILPGFQKDPISMQKSYGLSKAQELWNVSQSGLNLLHSFRERYNIACDYQAGALICAGKDSEMSYLTDLNRALTKIHHPSELLNAAETAERVGSQAYLGALYNMTAGHFHPLKYLYGLANAAQKQGVRIYHQSPVVAWKPHNGKILIRTPQGEILTKKMVVAGNAYQGRLIPGLRSRFLLARTLVVATEPLAIKLNVLPHNHACFEARHMLSYYRKTADNRLIFGGGDSISKVTGDRRLQAKVFKRLIESMHYIFPQLKDTTITHRWGGYFSVTTNFMPEVGHFDRQIYFAHGCNGHGIGFTHMAAQFMAQSIAGNDQPIESFKKIRGWPISLNGKLDNVLIGTNLLWHSLQDKIKGY